MLTPADTQRVGGKAANYGLLRRVIPSNAGPAAAAGFRLWNEFLDQPIIGTLTLRAQIASQLAPHSAWPPADPPCSRPRSPISAVISPTTR